MDPALCRRFLFIEMMLDIKVLEDLNIGTIIAESQTLNLAEIFTKNAIPILQ